MTGYVDCTVDFVSRTIENLRIIEKRALAEGEQRYEITQLVNSLLGLLVMPQQADVFAHRQYLLRDLAQEGWSFPLPDRGHHNPQELTSLLRKMRNSIAHWRLEFQSQGGQLARIIMEDIRPDTGRVTWKASMQTSELRRFVRDLSRLTLECLEAH